MGEVNLRKTYHHKLVGYLAQLNRHSTTPLSYYEITTLKKRAEETMARCEHIQEILVGAAVDDAALAVQESAFSPIECTFQEIMNKISYLLLTIPNPAATPTPPPPGGTTAKLNVKLPAIELPTFDGNFANWVSFKDLFIATVDNNKQLADSQKLQYLKSALHGEPSNLIKSMTITDANYKESWKLLDDRYDNKREIVSSLVNKFLNYKQLKSESAQELQALHDCVCESIRSLNVLKCPTDKWDDLLVIIVLSKLDPTTKREWAIRQTGSNLPTFDELCKFIMSHIRGLLATGASSNSTTRRDKPVKVHHVNSESAACNICSKSHQNHQCNELQAAAPADRCSMAKTHQLCFNCLSKGHSAKSCSSKRSCKKCGRRHHTLLHLNGEMEGASARSQSGSSATQPQQPSSNLQSNHISVESHAILKTAVVNVPDRYGNHQPCRVFIDGGSQGDFISEACVSRLQLQRSHRSVTVTGFGSTHVGKSRGEVSIRLISRYNREISLSLTAHVMPRLSSFLPTKKCTVHFWPHLNGLQLADPNWNKPASVDIIIGVKQYAKVMLSERRQGPDQSPVAFESIFGWIICGEVIDQTSGAHSVESLHVSVNPDLDFIRKFWETEELPSPRILTQEEKHCEDHFQQTYRRNTDGRFVVSIPFNGQEKNLGYSREAAVRRWKQVERRLQRNDQHCKQYTEFLKEYLDLGHMVEIPENQVCEISGETNYLPHHFVLNAESSTTKLRVVFDGSAKTTTGISLNQTMLVGATLQDDLYDLLLRFRSYPIVLKADIAKMFRQFLLSSSDTDYHRIVWRESPEEPLRDYRLQTVTYGTACATNLSTRCLIQLASDCEGQYPSAATAIKESMFVDDLLVGETTPERAITLFNELQLATKSACLELRKWCTNSKDVLCQIPEKLREMDPQAFQERDSTIKALGVRWHPSTDEFRFSNFAFNREDKLTMRILLSNLARVFDPLGLISCVTIRAKLLYQELWRLALGWDDEIPVHVRQLWDDYEDDLKKITLVNIPRRVTIDGASRMEIHGFADSSEKALGGIVYLRSITSDGVSVHFVTSKTKVAPLKQVSLPRLELEAALLTSKLVVRVSKAMKLTNYDIFMWSDSTIALRWIAAPPRRWKTFVANRVAKIQDLVPPESWRHVPGTDNPADMASRGVAVEEIINNSMWWKGPTWLSDRELPLFAVPPTEEVDKEERNLPVLTSHVEVEPSFAEQYSSLQRLKRAIVYLKRFISWLKWKRCLLGSPTPVELKDALLICVKKVQQQHFSAEIEQLRKAKQLKPNSKLQSLFPFLDNVGVLRVSGRLTNSNLPEKTKHPIILPANCHLVYLLVHHLHHSMFHAGFQHVWSTLQREYWIIRGRDRVRHIIRSCVVCRRYRASTAEQLMGSLPSSRVTPARPFLHTGLDFAGVFNLKNPIGRAPKTYKGYLCIFVCMATKAVHLEAVSSLSTDAFLDALRRFVSRRGLCAHLYSDCGTNFIGAERELKKFVRAREVNEKIANGLSSSSIQWHFNPPSAPHHGGLWEAAVKSAKFHLRRVIGNAYLTFEQFSTILCQIEAVLNSRPLTPLSSDPGDFGTLTPGHFLIGEPLLAVPDADTTTIPTQKLNVFQQQQQRVQHFWRRWSREYLNSLQQRNKWRWEKDNVRVGDLVLIVEETSPGFWKMGRIVEIHPGDDGRVRVVSVKTATSIVKRPIVKLVPLLREDEPHY